MLNDASIKVEYIAINGNTYEFKNYIPLMVLPDTNNHSQEMRLFELFYRSYNAAAIRIFDLNIASMTVSIPSSVNIIVYHQ